MMLKRYDHGPLGTAAREAGVKARSVIAALALLATFWALSGSLQVAARRARSHQSASLVGSTADRHLASHVLDHQAVPVHGGQHGDSVAFTSSNQVDDVVGPSSLTTPPAECTTASWPHLRAVVMTGGTRIASLNRLLRSLVEADSMGDRIDVDVWIDVPDHDRSSQAHRDRLALAHDIRALRSNGTYTHGHVRTFVWSQPAGLRKQWLETWDRSSPCGLGAWTPEIGLILEDDLELSPFFWRWLKAAHAAYGKDPRVAGFTLQRASLCAKKCDDLGGGPYHSPAAFYYPLVGSWGYSPTVRHWIRFRHWYSHYTRLKNKPYVEGLTPTEWYRSFEKAGTANRRMWTMHHIKYADTHQDRYTVYVKCPDNKTLAQNHLEAGINYAKKSPSQHTRLLEWDESIVKFPKFPVELDWGGRQTGGHGDCGGFL